MATRIDMKSGFQALGSWAVPSNPNDIEILSALTERSLKEVIALTEYEDTKAQRILTAIAFLAALAGAIFAISCKSLLDAQVLATHLSLSLKPNWIGIAVIGGFALYSISLAVGASIVLWAVKPTFNVPSSWTSAPTMPASFLFFQQILSVPPDVWVNAYKNSTVTALSQEYIKNSVMETYIVAEKVRIKLEPLTQGVRILYLSTVFLAIWLPFALLAVAAPKFSF